MASSGTRTFNLQIADVIQEAYERLGVSSKGGYDLITARRSLNLLMIKWINQGVNLFTLHLHTVAVNSFNNTTYPTFDLAANGYSDILTAACRDTDATPDQDIEMERISYADWLSYPNKYATGQPSQYFVDRQITPIINLYQAPNLSTYTTLKYYPINRIEDAGGYTKDPDTPFRFLPCMVAGLAYYISFMKAAEKTQMLKMAYEDEMKRALDEDGSRTSLYISPQTFFGDGV